MSVLLTLVLAAAPCFVANDASPGWKQVALPDDAPALAAVGNVQQFRTDAQVTIVEEKRDVFRPGDEEVGRTAFRFVLGTGGHSLSLEFAQPLRGAEVDVMATGSSGVMTLMDRERQGGGHLHLTWGENDVSEVTIVVHQHLRPRPVVRSFRSERRLAGDGLVASNAYQLPHSLYYLQPSGAAVRLCHDPARELVVKPDLPATEARPMPVTLRPG